MKRIAGLIKRAVTGEQSSSSFKLSCLQISICLYVPYDISTLLYICQDAVDVLFHSDDHQMILAHKLALALAGIYLP